MAILALTVLLDDTLSLLERLAPAPFSQLIYCLADDATLSGSPPVAPACRPVQCDALSILPYVGGESLRQSRLNYIIVKALLLPPRLRPKWAKKNTTHTHSSSPVVCSSKDSCTGSRYEGGKKTVLCLDESIRLWWESGGCGESEETEAVNRGLRATFHSPQRPSVNWEAEELKENLLFFSATRVFGCLKGK